MKRFEQLTDEETSLLSDSLRSRQCYLLLGSGVSLDSEGPQGRLRSTGVLRAEICKLKGIPDTSSLQQAYSLLTDEERKVFLTDHYTCTRPGDTIQTISRFPWRRIYTLNIDNCFEVAFSQFLKSAEIDPSRLEVKNFLDDFQDLAPDVLSSIIHLHGAVQHQEAGYIFSHAEYAKNITRPNSWMMTLVQLIRMEPFVVAGTSLEEIDVTYYLEQRNRQSARKDIAPSILIEPFPNALTERLCDNHELVLFRGTAQDFFSTLERRHGSIGAAWLDPVEDELRSLNLSKRTRVLFSSTFEHVPKAPKKNTEAAIQFLLGAEPTWEALECASDIPRDVTLSLRKEIVDCAKDPEFRVFLLLDEPGSGKTALLKRLALSLAKSEEFVFYFTAQEAIDEDLCADILTSIVGPCYIFVDDWADHAAYFTRILANIAKRDIIFVCAERSYRKPYIESGLAEEDFKIVEGQLDLTAGEAADLVAKFQREGLSAIDKQSSGGVDGFLRSLRGEPIAVAACRIQNNFRSFDAIVRDVIKESPDEERRVYVAATIARFCYSDGVRRSVLYDATRSSAVGDLVNLNSRLPLKYHDRARQFVLPSRAIVADRVLKVLLERNQKWVADVFVRLANALAARVNRKQIRARAPDARLAGRLLDYDQIVKRFIDQHAEYFYESVREQWSWNSRYWEQLALLKLDRYLVDKSDRALLLAGVQHARHAYSIERHPLSLTTLAKMLFVAMQADNEHADELFGEAWSLISLSIDIESGWENIKATAFIVCFRGVLDFVRGGGLLTGQQADRLRDVLAITHARKLRDPQLRRLRDEVVEAAL